MWLESLLTTALILILVIVVNVYKDKKKKKCKKITGYISSLKVTEGKQLIFSIKGKLNIMALTMTDSQQASGVLTFVDKKGVATDVPDGNVTVTSSDTAVAAVTYDDPTNTVTVVAGVPGVAALTIVATNAAGVVLPFDDVAVEITSGDATSGSIAFGAPTEQP